MLICSKCGIENADNSNYCVKCGTSLHEKVGRISISSAIKELNATYSKKFSKNIWFEDNMPRKYVEMAIKMYAKRMPSSEKPLLLLNKKTFWAILGGILAC